MRRKDKYLIPGGAMVIEADDVLVVLSDTEEVVTAVCARLKSGATGIGKPS